MHDNVKILVIALLAGMLAVASSKVLQPSNAALMQDYRNEYQMLSQQSEITSEEKQRLETLFKEINAEQNVKAELMEIIVRHALLFLVLAPLAAWSARASRLNNNRILAGAALIFAAYIIVGLVVVGALFASIFVLAGIVFRKAESTAQP